MRRGCISFGELQCDQCHNTVPYAERYLAVNEEAGVEVEEGQIAHYCVECAMRKGYAYYNEEKGERILTFFPRPEH